MNSKYKKELSTMSGMWGIWDYDTYKDIDDYEKWENLFCEDEDIEKQIAAKTFVPLYVHENGKRAFTVKINGQLSEREEKYAFMKSDRYLIKTNGKIVISGIENINAQIREDTLPILLTAGIYSVSAYLIAWDNEPGAILENGEVRPDALSDFVVLISSEPDENYPYRTSVNTFKEYE